MLPNVGQLHFLDLAAAHELNNNGVATNKMMLIVFNFFIFIGKFIY